MSVSPSRTVSVSIERDPAAVYAYVSDPRNLPEWAPQFACSVRQDDQGWVVETVDGPVRITFAPDNAFGVADHRVTGDEGMDVLNPMRVLANGDGTEVLFTLFRPEDATDEQFQRDAELVTSDLRTLKRLRESGHVGR